MNLFSNIFKLMLKIYQINVNLSILFRLIFVVFIYINFINIIIIISESNFQFLLFYQYYDIYTYSIWKDSQETIFILDYYV